TSLLQRGLRRDDTRDVSKQIIQQTRHWIIEPMNLEPLDTGSEQEIEGQHLLLRRHRSSSLLTRYSVFLQMSFDNISSPGRLRRIQPQVTLASASAVGNLRCQKIRG